MTPAVKLLGVCSFLGSICFAIGIYDPVMYSDVKRIGIPGWSTEVNENLILKTVVGRTEGKKLKKGR